MFDIAKLAAYGILKT